MSKLIAASQEPAADGRVMDISPQSAGWKYVGFQVYSLIGGQTLKKEWTDMETCIVLLTGKAHIRTSEQQWKDIGRRMSIFEEIPPYSVYISSGEVEVEAVTDLQIAVCLAPGKGSYKSRLITPEDVGVEIRGQGSMERRIHNILPEQEKADSLLVVEVFTPNGHWSSYPPHKHDQNRLPKESLLEETYYHRIRQDRGFAVQRVYTDDRTLDETLIVKDGDAVMVPKGYHPVSAPPGYDLYYLNVMAGPVRTWKFHNDPDHEWLMKQ